MKVGDKITIEDDKLAFYHAIVQGNSKDGYFLKNAISSTKYALGKSPRVIYPTLQALEYAVYETELDYLEHHKLVPSGKIYLGGYNYYCVYTPSTGRYFLNNIGYGNDAIFIHLGIEDKYQWCTQFISGPLSSGSFPECETLDDLAYIVKALLKELIDRMSKGDLNFKDSKDLDITDKLSLLQVETEPKLIKL